MSESNPESETSIDMSQYRSTAGAESKMADVASDDHALKSKFGDSEDAKEFEYEAELMGERVAQWYDDPAAAIREYLSNAETACVRRAKHELINEGISPPDDVREMLDLAKSECDYAPVIEINYNRKPEATRMTIEDNGIGISTDEYVVLKKIGYSASHADGERLGQFGMGFMSGFQLTGVENPFRFYTRSYPSPSESRPEEAYSALAFVTNFEYLDDLKDGYGTRFEFPNFSDKADEIPIRTKVDEYADGMRIPVLFRESDESGQEVYNEDYTPTNLEDDYPDDSTVVSYEDEFFKAVASPSRADGRRGVITYNISMPIRRNTDTWNDDDRFEAPWKWDFRAKAEDGPVVKCDSRPEIVGLKPISASKYDRLDDSRKNDCIERDEVPDDAVIMPKPASSRDSYESGHDDFWRYVSKKLDDEWASVASERFADLSDWSSFEDMSAEEKSDLLRAYNHFGPSYKDADADNIQSMLEDKMDVTVPTTVCERLHWCKKTVDVVREGSSAASTKGACTGRKIWKIIDNADRVFMGKSISQKKAEIAWGLDGDTTVVRVNDTDMYDEYSDLFGWELLKDLPSSNLKEELPSLDDAVASKWENQKSSTNRSSGSARTSRDPTTKRIQVRFRKGKSRYFSKKKAGSLYDTLDDGETFNVGRSYYDDFKYLILYDQTELSGSAAPTNKASKKKGIATAAVPKYVYKYLIDAEYAFESMDGVREKMREEVRDEFGDHDLVLFVSGQTRDAIDDDPARLIEYIEEETDLDLDVADDADVSLRSVDDAGGWYYASADDVTGTDFVYCNGSNSFTSQSVRVSDKKIALWEKLPDWIDTDSEAYKHVFGDVSPHSEEFDTRLTLVEDAGSLPDV